MLTLAAYWRDQAKEYGHCQENTAMMILIAIREKDFDSLYDYLDAIKPDRVYRLFGIILIEKSGKRYLVRDNNGYQPCDLGDVMDDVDIFNTFDIPSSPKHKLYIAW